MRVIHCVHQYETAARLIVGTYEPILYKIYNLCTYAKLSSLISLVYSQASYKNSRIITSLFIVSDGFMKFPPFFADFLCKIVENGYLCIINIENYD